MNVVGGCQLRLRAALLVNLVAMRHVVSRHRNHSCVMSPENLSTLQRANFLMHSALNSYSFANLSVSLLLGDV